MHRNCLPTVKHLTDALYLGPGLSSHTRLCQLIKNRTVRVGVAMAVLSHVLQLVTN